MKLKLAPQILKTTVTLSICIGLSITHPVSASTKNYGTTISWKELKGKGKQLIKEKYFTQRNKTSVKIYLDASQKKVHVIAKENSGKQIDFFLFDLEGTLIHNHKLKVKDHHRITNLVKGVYVYRVFCGDEETASGQLEIQ